MVQIKKAHPINEWLAKVIFLLLPTLLICYFILWNANEYYSVLRSQHFLQTTYVAIGMLGASVLYSFRIRFLPTFSILVILFYFIYKGIDLSAMGEMDTFFLSHQFRLFAITFTVGWLIGWAFMRLRFFSIFISSLFLCACIILISKYQDLYLAKDAQVLLVTWLTIFAPVVIYSIYIIFSSELIHNYKDKSQYFWWYLTKRLFLFLFCSILVLGAVVWFMKQEISETLVDYGSGGKDGDNSMLKKNKDGTFDIQDYSRLRSKLNRSNDLLFAAYIDNFIPGTETPNPLYLTAFYYSRFDTLTETFERDSLIPENDLFLPNVNKIPLYFTEEDSSVLSYALKEKYRNTVEIEVYRKDLSDNSFVAPSTSFFVQPIAIEKNFQSEFRSAYRAKSLVSNLNSAYFVYNLDQPVVRKFQEQRFQTLRSVKNYDGVNTALMQYYTHMPKGTSYEKITALSKEITNKASTPVDKVLAIRDYFLAKDENGKQIYSYSDNPGVPDIPSASKLMYFLFDNKKGYCAYYAGATLFMLRSLGIPSRITVGFLTEDRSTNNKGWYWYYADQAHAWVQVYFPGYGWLDFDTTVGNDEARESSQPDGTPPMQPPKAYLAANGVITALDTNTKSAKLSLFKMVFHDKELTPMGEETMQLNLALAQIQKDSANIYLKDVQIGDTATAISFAESIKNLKKYNIDFKTAYNKIPQPAPIDELHIKAIKANQSELPDNPNIQDPIKKWKNIIAITAISILFIIIILLLIPRTIWLYYQSQFKTTKSLPQKSYYAFMAANFYLHQLGWQKKTITPLQFSQKIDQQFDSNFQQFMHIYLKLKYGRKELTTQDVERINMFLPELKKQIHLQIKASRRFWLFLRPLHALKFFGLNLEDEQEIN